MAAANRANVRTPGRTPPFVLVGLVVLLGFFGYSYYSLGQTNSQLAKELEGVRIKSRSIEDRNSESEKNLETAHEDLRRAQASFEEARAKSEERESELNTCKQDLATKGADSEKAKTLLDQCDEKLHVRDQELNDLKGKNTELQKTLDAERQKVKTCDIASCNDPVQQVLKIAVQLTGSDKLTKALVDAGLDGANLMKDNHFPDPNVQQQPPPAQNKEQPAQEKKDDKPNEAFAPGTFSNDDGRQAAKLPNAQDGKGAASIDGKTKLPEVVPFPASLRFQPGKEHGNDDGGDDGDDQPQDIMKVPQSQSNVGSQLKNIENENKINENERGSKKEVVNGGQNAAEKEEDGFGDDGSPGEDGIELQNIAADKNNGPKDKAEEDNGGKKNDKMKQDHFYDPEENGIQSQNSVEGEKNAEPIHMNEENPKVQKDEIIGKFENVADEHGLDVQKR